MGYHINEIPRGVYGEFSKITEEFLESQDAHCQGNSIMVLLELSDLLGAIEAYCVQHNMTLVDLIKMKESTNRAFLDGTRKPRT